MTTLQALRALGPIDLRSVFRDSLLAWMMVLPVAIGLLLRGLLPPVDAWSTREFDLALLPYTPLLATYFVVLMPPMLVGMVIGFLLLDERDDDTLTALLVTPLPLHGYLAYRVGLPLVLCAATTVIAFGFSGLPGVTWAPVLLAMPVASLSAPILSLFLAAFAANKIQGFALIKGLGTVAVIPVIAYFVTEPWQLLAGVVPIYWPAKALWLANEGRDGVVGCLTVGLVYQALLLAFSLRRFQRVVHR